MSMDLRDNLLRRRDGSRMSDIQVALAVCFPVLIIFIGALVCGYLYTRRRAEALPVKDVTKESDSDSERSYRTNQNTMLPLYRQPGS